jgi:hypothetical protein
MIFLGASCFPSVKNNSNGMTFFFVVFNEGLNQLIPLLFKVFMLDPNQVITVNDNRGNGKPPLTLYGGKADLKLDADSAYCPQWIYTLIFSSFPCKRESSGLVLDSCLRRNDTQE